MTERWVRHISGTGPKYRVINQTHDHEWDVDSNDEPMNILRLPRPDYVLCDPPAPPERWVDVTYHCTVINDKTIEHNGRSIIYACEGHYRLSKVQQTHQYPKDPTWAFIVERREPAP